jgi:HK97 family phage prohead protease
MRTARCRAFAEIRSAVDDDDDFVIQGIASAGTLDRKGTFIDQESLWKATSRFTTRTLFYQHDWDAPIGKVTKMARGEDELLIEAKIGRDFEIPLSKGFSGISWNVNNLRKMIQQGFVNAFSIGFDARKQDAEEEGDPPTLFVTDLMEISVVTVPANEKTTFSFARSMVLDGAEIPSMSTTRNPKFSLDLKKDEDDLAELSSALRMLDESLRR